MISNFKFQISKYKVMHMLFMLIGIAFVTIAALDTAYGLDPRHSAPIVCASCHIPHNSIGGGMTNADSNANLCLSCHTSTGMAGKKPFVDNMKATPGKLGTSHKWDVPVYNPDRGTGFPTNPDMIPRLDPIVRGTVTEDSADKVSVKNLSSNYNADEYVGRYIQFYAFGPQGGTATGGNLVNLEDSSKNWAVNSWTDYYINMKSGNNAGQKRKITGNTAKTITVETFDAPVLAGDSYEIWSPTYANSGTIKKVTKNTANSVEFEAFPVAPKKNDKFAIMDATAKFSCSTCHNQHLQQAKPWNPASDSTYVPLTPDMADPSQASNNRKFLRVDNDRSQLCLECHKDRGKTSSIDTRIWHEGEYKSHPIAKKFIDDTGRNVDKPAQFNSTPFDADYKSQIPADVNDKRFNGNSSGDTILTNNVLLDTDGKIQCMSCHGIHYIDSDATTEDKP